MIFNAEIVLQRLKISHSTYAIYLLHLSGTHLTSFVTATPLSLIQASNGQVYILQNQQQLPHQQPQHQQITGCCHPSGNPQFFRETASNSAQSSQGTTTSTTGTTSQFFPTQMILAAAQTVSPGAAASGDNCNINSQLILAATTTNKLTSCLSTSNWLQPTTTASPAIHGESKKFFVYKSTIS